MRYDIGMSSPKLQIVFGPDDGAEIYIVLDGRMHRTTLDLREAPFSAIALETPEVKAALKAWIVGAEIPVWMSWADLEDALAAYGLSVESLVERFPPRWLQNII